MLIFVLYLRDNKVKNRAKLTLIAIILSAVGYAQTGTISGVVKTKQDSVSIWGASVYISGTIHSSFTEEDGTFMLTGVAPGTYNISTEDFTTGDSALTRGIVVIAGDTSYVEVKIGVSVKIGEVIQISYDQPKSETAAAALEEEKKETKVTTIVSSEEFKKKGDSKVTDAAGRASGVTIEGGKYVYVRGLSDRYSKTLLDGTEIPGLDPNRNAVQLDIFPTTFVQSLKIIKSFTPDLPGDFTGGLVDIRTKDFPDSLEVSVSTGVSYNSLASFNSNFLTANTSNTDFLGYDNGDRELPSTLNSLIVNDRFPEYSKALFDNNEARNMEIVMDQLNGNMVPIRSKSSTPYNFGFTMGNTISFNQKGDSLGLKAKRKLGYVVGLNYRSSISYFDGGAANVYDLSGSLTEKSELTPLRLMEEERASEEVLVSGIAKLGFEFNQDHKIGFSFLKNQSGKHTASIAEGENIDDEFYYRSQKIGYIERAMNNFNLNGNHKLPFLTNKMELDWTGAFTLSAQKEPDLRFFNDNLDENGEAEFREQNYTGPVRYWRDMTEQNIDAKVNLMLPFQLKDSTILKVKVGGSYVNKAREFDEKRLDYASGSKATYDGNVSTYLSDGNTGWLQDGTVNDIGVYVINQTNQVNNYSGTSSVTAGYGMAELPLTKKLQVVTGVRMEMTDINVQSKDLSVAQSSLIKTNFLPAINFSYNLIDGQAYRSKRDTSIEKKRDLKLRGSFFQSIARPNFRELAPFAVEDFVNNSVVIGNPDLLLTEVKNYDVRLEFYPESGEQLTLAAFYKDFTNPIEQITSPTAANIEYTWVNNAKGRLYGIELELRKKLNFISEKLSAFEASGNLTLVQSSSDVNKEELELIRGNDPDHADTRPLFGQSPYIINGALAYNNDTMGLNVNVAFNIFGDRLVLVTKGGLPDIYELSRPSLDFNIAKTFSDRLKITFRAKNLLNPDYKQVFKVKTESDRYTIKPEEEGFIYRNYKKGVNISLSFSYKF